MIIRSPKIISSDGFLATVQNSSPNAWWKMNAPNTATGGQFAHKFLDVPGVAGYNASTPDAAPLRITGDIDLQAKVSFANWVPSAAQDAIGKWRSAGNLGYILRLNTDGKLRIFWTADGTTQLSTASTVATGFAGNAIKYIRATKKVSDGSTKFYTSDDGIAWTQLGTTVVAGATSIFASTEVLCIGSQNNTAAGITGNLYSARILNGYDGAGSIVFDADFTTLPTGTTTFTESSANAATVTVAGPVAADYVSPFSSEAIALNGAVFGAAGPVATDPAMTFDGVNDQLVTQSVSLVCGQSALSVFGFIKTATTAKALMFSSGASNDLTFSIVTNKLLLTLFDHTTTDTLPGSASVVDNVWHEVGFVISAGHCQMYIDGVADGGNTPISGTFAGAQAAVLRLMSDTTNFFNGSAQHWRVYQRALSATEIARIYARRNIR